MQEIREYQQKLDNSDIARLWSECFSLHRSVNANSLSEFLHEEGVHFVCIENNQIIGFISGKTYGLVSLLMVHPGFRRQRIAQKLWQRLLSTFENIDLITIGGSGMLWHGVPLTDTQPAQSFFEKMGAVKSKIVTDMFAKVDDVPIVNADLRTANEQDISAALEFQKKYFPHWEIYFKKSFEQKKFKNILLAFFENQIAGMTLISYPQDFSVPGSQWIELTSQGLGTMSLLGVAPEFRGHRLGAALISTTTTAVKNAGGKYCFINHCDAVSLFEKLGYRPWGQYQVYEFKK
jgi:ribosomal protein S18 acetylase RimI-like enzyme